MKPVFSDMVGNRELLKRLSNDILTQKLAHAYVIEGPRGSGKHMLAQRIAAAIGCEAQRDESAALPCMHCTQCRRIFGGNCPDIIYVRREDTATIGVDVVRFLKSDVLVPPNDISTKVYVIEEAHLLTEQAQNALLLTLEEPPPYVLFLLLCDTAATLLDTVRSRAPTLRLEPIPIEAIDRCISKTNADAAQLKKSNEQEYFEVLAAANGSIGTALRLLNPKTREPILQLRNNAREFARLVSVRKNSATSFLFLKKLPQKREELIEQMQLFLYCMRDLLLVKQTETAPLCFFAKSEDAFDFAYHFTTPELLSLCAKIDETVDTLQRNANVRLTLTAFATATGLF
ncbi:MAG: hypothetical protein E7637_04265 [Ruminococcaceae bacterium]|nr:hypothetical protein [Oscillospiraceae bacterium]